MTPAEWEEYERRLALRAARKREVEEAIGFSDAPGQPTRRQYSPAGSEPRP